MPGLRQGEPAWIETTGGRSVCDLRAQSPAAGSLGGELSVGDVCDRWDPERDGAGIHQVPVLFGRGRRLFDVLPSRVELEIVRVIDTPQATHIRYRVRR
jgi:hypothetical protein